MINDKLFLYYKAQKIVPDEEWDSFAESLRQHLPTTFRVAGSRQWVNQHSIIQGMWTAFTERPTLSTRLFVKFMFLLSVTSSLRTRRSHHLSKFHGKFLYNSCSQIWMFQGFQRDLPGNSMFLRRFSENRRTSRSFILSSFSKLKLFVRFFYRIVSFSVLCLREIYHDRRLSAWSHHFSSRLNLTIR